MYGAEAVILTMSRALAQAQHGSAIGVFSNSSRPNLQLHQAAIAIGVESHLVQCTGQLDRSVPGSIRKLVAHVRADVVHAHGFKADVYAWAALRNSPVPLVSTCHTWYDNDLAVRLYGALDRRVLRKFSAVVAVSGDVKERLLKAGISPDRIRLITNGIDLDPFAVIRHANFGADRPLTVGLIGRLAQEKGVDLFLRAAAQVLAELPSTRFLVVGDGPDRAALQALIEELHIGSSVSLLGRSENMPATYASLDLMVSASRQEGLPIALLEGMASRLPIVATNVGAVSTVIRNEVTGLLVPPQDIPQLTVAIRKLLLEPALRDRLGNAARQSVEQNFSATRMTAEYLRLYKEVTGSMAAQPLRSEPAR